MGDFVPSYQNEEERRQIREEKDRKDRKRNIIIGIIVAIIIVIVISLGYILINKQYSLYYKYKDKMDVYGFSSVYNDGDSNTKDKVTKSEAVKMILSCVYNTPDISGIAMPTDKTYSNAIWVEYAIKQGIVSSEEVNEKTADDKVRYKDVLVWLYNVKAKILDMEPDTEEKTKIKDINAYNPDQRLAIYDLINSGVMVENTSRINGNDKLYKGKLNELIINFCEVYNTITVSNTRLNINPEKIPENVDKYPYTLASVQKDVYELPFINEGKEGFIYPVEYFPQNKQYYNQIKDYVENYYSVLTNIDYETIDANQIVRKIKKNALNEIDQEKLNKYVEYVKLNHIKTTSTVTGQFPCVYFDGKDYRVRVKIDFTIDSSDTNKNIFLYDNNVEYSQNQYTLYVDVKMQKNNISNTLFIEEGTIASMLAKKSNGIVSGD